jgi:hypothetical protein
MDKEVKEFLIEMFEEDIWKVGVAGRFGIKMRKNCKTYIIKANKHH